MRSLGSIICVAVAIAVAYTTIPTLAQNSPGDFVAGHNSPRAAVGVGPVTWNNTVAAYAQTYANQRIGDCKLVHSNGPYGENLFWGSGDGFTAAFAVRAWADEKQYYNYASNSCAAGKECGHYTQVVWRSSTQIGCARARCKSGGVFIICSYYPPGNYVGERPY
ncbi:pathogenesis-related protein PRB1-2-like [Zingiber officinale]|uniref:pathogenesis-related protein PRB1-2-like n=1 Tax=Zingiber officinale TaxID=94328 RepID=UPI001C4B6E6B|nr:pathogenesis-related protein PRB1-2-like [Zingiber officinale]